MIPEQILRTRQKLLDLLPVTGEILRGSLIERTVFRHTANCEKCANGEGHRLLVLTVTYSGNRTRQISLGCNASMVGQKLREALEAICELNHSLLRPDAGAPKRRSRRA
jgi:hypothetical protein